METIVITWNLPGWHVECMLFIIEKLYSVHPSSNIGGQWKMFHHWFNIQTTNDHCLANWLADRMSDWLTDWLTDSYHSSLNMILGVGGGTLNIHMRLEEWSTMSNKNWFEPKGNRKIKLRSYLIGVRATIPQLDQVMTHPFSHYYDYGSIGSDWILSASCPHEATENP